MISEYFLTAVGRKSIAEEDGESMFSYETNANADENDGAVQPPVLNQR